MHMCMQQNFFTQAWCLYMIFIQVCAVSQAYLLIHWDFLSYSWAPNTWRSQEHRCTTLMHNTDVVLSLLSLHSRRIYSNIFWRKECGLWKNNYIRYPNILLTNSLLFETGSHYDTQSGLELTIQLRLALNLWFSLPQPFRCWDYKYTRVNGHFNFWNINEKACALLFLGVQRIELRSFHMLGNS